MRFVTAAVSLFIGVLGTTLRAQDLEPRAYSNSPIGLNFVIAGYDYASGTVLTDPSLPLENVSNESHVGVLGFATTFGAFGQSGQFGLIVPYASIASKGLVFGLPHTRYVDGFADTAFRFSMNFVGAPALTAAEFQNYRQDFIFGMSLRVTAPLSQYDGEKLVNIGTNRWSHRVKYREIIADKVSKIRWSWGCVPAIDSCGRTRVLLKLPSSPASTSVPMPRIESDSIQAHENRTRRTAFIRAA